MKGNILFFTRVDRAYFVKKIVEYIFQSNYNVQVIVVSTFAENGCSLFADEFIYIDDTSVNIQTFKKIILKYHIGGVFFCSNFDLWLLLDMKDWLEQQGVKWYGPDAETLDICLSKKKQEQWLNQIGVKSPKSFTKEQLYELASFSVILKPANGQGSEHVVEAHSISEIEWYEHRISNMVIQEHILGKEFTVDCFNSYERELLLCVPRERLIVNGPHSTVAKISVDQRLKNIGKKLAEHLNIVGPWNFQIFTNYKEEIIVHDINPRIANGLCFSMEYGYPFQSLIVEYLVGSRLSIPDYQVQKHNIVYSYMQFAK